MRLDRPLSLCVVILMAAAPHARAQAAPDALPYPLARALASDWLNDVVVGSLPPGWPAELVPPAPAYVLGGSGRRASMTAVFADSTTSPLGAFQQRLEAAGFRRPGSTGPYIDGFMSSASGSEEGYCRDSMRVSPVVVRGGGAPYLLRVSLSTQRGRGCGEQGPDARRTASLRIPSLTPPSGVARLHSHGNSGSNSVSSQAVFTDTANTAQMLASHFARQLAAAGWTVAPPVADRRVAVAALEARDSTGVTWHGVLLIHTHGGRHDASINMNAPTER